MIHSGLTFLRSSHIQAKVSSCLLYTSLFELGARALQNVDLIRSADIQMREISRLTKETIHLGALDEDSIVYIHKIDSMYNLRMYSRIGRRNPRCV